MEQHPKKRATPASWKRGQSGNPNGRPRAGLALADRIREKFDPDLLVDLALRLAGDETTPLDKRLAALLPLVQMGYLKPPTTAAVHVTGDAENAPRRDWSRLTLEQRRTLLQLHRAAAVPALAGADDENGSNDA